MISREQRIRIGQSAVVFEQNRVEVREPFGNGVGDLLRGGRAVFRDGNAAERDDRFRHDGLRQRDARNGESRRIHRMCVNDRVHVRALFIDAHVHLDFRRRFEPLVRLQHFPVFVHFADEFGSHEALADARRSAQKFVVVELDGNVTVVGCDHPAVVDTLADFANLFFDLVLVYHFCSPVMDFIFIFIIQHNPTKVNRIYIIFLSFCEILLFFV